MSVCCQDESVKGCRDAALIAVLHGAGLRRAEVVALELADWNPAEGYGWNSGSPPKQVSSPSLEFFPGPPPLPEKTAGLG